MVMNAFVWSSCTRRHAGEDGGGAVLLREGSSSAVQSVMSCRELRGGREGSKVRLRFEWDGLIWVKTTGIAKNISKLNNGEHGCVRDKPSATCMIQH